MGGGTTACPMDGATTIREYLLKALDIGYRHIDGACRYAGQVASGAPGSYYADIRAAIAESKVPRDQLWITWKAGKTPKEVVELLGCGYIDLWIGTQTNSDFVRFHGVENRYMPASELPKKTYANQVQALQYLRPSQKYSQGLAKSLRFMKECNDAGVKIQLYSVNSAVSCGGGHDGEGGYNDVFTNGDWEWDTAFYYAPTCMHYFMSKYIPKGNTIIVGTRTGSTLQKNYDMFRDVLQGKVMSDAECCEFEARMEKPSRRIQRI